MLRKFLTIEGWVRERPPVWRVLSVVQAPEGLDEIRRRSAKTRDSFAGLETSSTGELPYFTAIQNVAARNKPVITKFCQALSAHWPCHASWTELENGLR